MAVQLAEVPPFAPLQLQTVDEPANGKDGLAGEAVPTEQRVDPPGQVVVADG